MNDEIDELEEQIKLNAQGLKLQEEYKEKETRYKSVKDEINAMLFPGKKIILHFQSTIPIILSLSYYQF